MVGERRVLLHLVHLLGVHVRRRVFLTIDHAGLQRLIDFGERHHLRDRTKRAELRFQHLGRLDAELEALVVFRRNELLVRAHLLEAVVPIGQAGDPLLVEQAEELLAERAVGHLPQRREVRENVREIENLEFLDADRAELGERRRQHLHRTELQRLEFFLVLVELRVRINLDLHLAVGVFRREFGEFLRSQSLRRVRRDNVAEFDDDRLLRGSRHDEAKRRDCSPQKHDLTHSSSRIGLWYPPSPFN